MTIAWYDPTNHHVSTDKNDPLFTPLGQVWPLYPKREWVGLTEEEVQLYAVQHRQMVNAHYDSVQNTNLITEKFDAPAFYKTIEAALRSKNT
jgi:hypothetical protein